MQSAAKGDEGVERLVQRVKRTSPLHPVIPFAPVNTPLHPFAPDTSYYVNVHGRHLNPAKNVKGAVASVKGEKSTKSEKGVKAGAEDKKDVKAGAKMQRVRRV